jgi:hypothetical protein
MGAQWAETDGESRTQDECSHEVPDVIDCDVHPQLRDGLVETGSLEVKGELSSDEVVVGQSERSSCAACIRRRRRRRSPVARQRPDDMFPHSLKSS